jgi:hypothetical protein
MNTGHRQHPRIRTLHTPRPTPPDDTATTIFQPNPARFQTRRPQSSTGSWCHLAGLHSCHPASYSTTPHHSTYLPHFSRLIVMPAPYISTNQQSHLFRISGFTAEGGLCSCEPDNARSPPPPRPLARDDRARACYSTWCALTFPSETASAAGCFWPKCALLLPFGQ